MRESIIERLCCNNPPFVKGEFALGHTIVYLRVLLLLLLLVTTPVGRS